jgi:signal transduction histidine kinase
LTAILGWARMISDSRVSEEDKAQGLEIIQRNALLQAQLVEDILDISRIVTES